MGNKTEESWYYNFFLSRGPEEGSRGVPAPFQKQINNEWISSKKVLSAV